uniref:Uncharacterized protein n=1 Tax=Opuntia streptacantha TaxID=393608 RepID=A0A7C8Z6U9_OPUST
METEHKAPPPGHRGFFSAITVDNRCRLTQKKHRGCSPPLSSIQPLRSIFPMLYHCFCRRHRIDRLTTNATVPSTPPTRHLDGGACGPRAASEGLRPTQMMKQSARQHHHFHQNLSTFKIFRIHMNCNKDGKCLALGKMQSPK